MIELHPTLVTKNGKPESVSLPYEEFVQIQLALKELDKNTPEPDPRYGGFFDNLSKEELARRQGVKPIETVEGLYGNGDPADWEGFDEALAQWRSNRHNK